MLRVRLFTIGHSHRSFEEFLSLLREFGIQCVADVRSFPAGKRQPHFGKSHLEQALPAAGICYVHFRDLGGYRRPKPDSRHTAWKTPGFRGYADYMETPAFLAAAAELRRIASERPTAAMCAEALWSRCHRQLISDWFLLQGDEVIHILGPRRTLRHRLTPFGRVEGGHIIYAG